MRAELAMLGQLLLSFVTLIVATIHGSTFLGNTIMVIVLLHVLIVAAWLVADFLEDVKASKEKKLVLSDKTATELADASDDDD